MKRFNLLFLLSAVCPLVLTGCNAEKSISWYESHPKEREATLSKCDDNPGKLRDTTDCINARKSEMMKMIKSNKGVTG